jgi:hypothetical protein
VGIYRSTIGVQQESQKTNPFDTNLAQDWSWNRKLEEIMNEESKQITVKFDPDGDLIVIQFCSPYKGQGSTEIAGGVVARTHPITGRIESLEIMDVSTRDGKLELPMMIEPALEMAGDD